jgi:hypothetical protein
MECQDSQISNIRVCDVLQHPVVPAYEPLGENTFPTQASQSGLPGLRGPLRVEIHLVDVDSRHVNPVVMG